METNGFNINNLYNDSINDKQYYIIYHNADIDGQCSGALVKYYLETIEHVLSKDIHMMPYDYDEDTSKYISLAIKHSNNRTYMVDICFKYEDMKLINESTELYWFDHHKAKIDEMMDLNIKGIQNEKYSACKICFDYLLASHFKDKPQISHFINLLSDYDTWNLDNYRDIDDYEQHAVAMNLYMRTINTNPITEDGYNTWKELLESSLSTLDIDYMTIIGQNIFGYNANTNQAIMENRAFEIMIPEKYTNGQGNIKAICCNGVSGSIPFKGFYDESKHDVMLTFNMNKDRNYNIGIYGTKNNVDCCDICKTLGGGGHFKASGATIKSINFEDGNINFILLD